MGDALLGAVVIATDGSSIPGFTWSPGESLDATASEDVQTMLDSKTKVAVPIPVKFAPSGAISGTMASDFFYRVWVIPAVIEVDNPTEGAPIGFEIWSAFPWDNELDAINSTGADGLELTIAPGSDWNPWETVEAGVIVTREAPPLVQALFVFDFRHDETELEFTAERATIVGQHAEQGMIERLEWKTDVLRSINGKTQRSSVRRNPRRRLSFDIVATTEQELRELSATLAGRMTAPVVLPLWAEHMTLTADYAGGDTIFADCSFAEIVEGDSLYVERRDRSYAELARVTEVNRGAGTFTLSNALTASFSAGDVCYPAVSAWLPDGTAINRHQTAAGRITLEALVTQRQELVGHGATVSTYEGLPLLERRPLANGTVSESYATNGQRLDFGGSIVLASPEALATITRSRQYWIEDQADLQFFRAFLAQVRGRAREFYVPTYRPNFIPLEQPENGETDVVIEAEASQFQFWIDQTNRRDVYLERTDRTGEVLRVSGITDQGDNTLRVSFSSPIMAEGLAPILSFSIVERARLATDGVQIMHDDNGATLSLTFEAGINDDANI
jgi:hypothetical protein